MAVSTCICQVACTTYTVAQDSVYCVFLWSGTI